MNFLTLCRLPIEDPFLDDALPGSSSQLGIPPVFGQCDAPSDQHGTAFNQFLAQLLEVGKDQDISVQVNPFSTKAGTDASPSVDGSTTGPAAAALVISQIAARSKVLAACEEQQFNQFVNEALFLQLKQLEKRIEHLQQVESAVFIQGKVLGFPHPFIFYMFSVPHIEVRNPSALFLSDEVVSMLRMILEMKCVNLQPASCIC
jgi:hypothetical protein